MQYVNVKMKNGFHYFGVLWTNRQNDDFITVTGVEANLAGKTEFTNDIIEIKIDDIEYAYASRETVCVDENGKSVVLEHVNILSKREWNKKGKLPPSWTNSKKRKELENQWFRNTDAEFLFSDGDRRINPETGEMFLEYYIQMDQWIEKQFEYEV
jgi:hypothetical protein